MRKFKFLLAFLLLVASGAWAQTRQLTGNIKDTKSGSSLASATIKVKGRNASAVTDANGGFSLPVPTGRVVLEISMIGYAPKSVTVDANETNVLIQLDQSTAQLSEVVVTALGINKEARKVGYSVQTVNGDNLDKARETNVASSLSGQVAGLNVHTAAGGPASTASILLRGFGSITQPGSPLFVINGIPMNNDNRGASGAWGGADQGDGIGNINPDDIETMTVLKGQAASALYGARAANGVIMITTKSGKKGNLSVDYNINSQWDKARNDENFQYQYGQGLEGAKPANSTAAQNTNRFSWGSKMDGSPYTQYNGQTYSYSPFKNNLKNFYRTAPTLTNTVSVNGGGDRGSFRLSVSDMDNSSIVSNSGTDRYTFNLAVEQKVTDKLTVNVNADYIDQRDLNRASLSDGPMNPNNFTFLAANVDERIFKPGYDSAGNEVVFSDDNYVTNPYFVTAKSSNVNNRKRLIASISAKYNFTNWIYLLGRVGYDYINDRSLGITPSGTNYSFNTAGQSGSYGLNYGENSESNMDALLGVNHDIVKDLNFTATLGANFRQNNAENIGISGGPFVIPFLYSYSNVVSFGRSYSVSNRDVHSGFYTADFSWRNMLTLSTTGRLDAYSTLPSSARTIFTPSVAGSFVFSELLHSPVLSYGKLRASWARTSGEPSQVYGTQIYYNVGNSINGVPTGNFSGTLPNLFLKPFTVDEYEFGTTLKFLQNRIGADVTYFHRTTNHEILSGPLSPSTGYTSHVLGTASIQNVGEEITLTGQPILSKDFNWNITLNMTFLHNKVLQTDLVGSKLGQGTYRPDPSTNLTQFIKGMSGPQITTYDYTYDAHHNIVVDASGLPISNGVLTPQGSVMPTFYGGFINSFTYKNWNLGFQIDFNYGNKILSASEYYSIYRGLNKMTLEGRETGFTEGVTTTGATNTKTATAQDWWTRIASFQKASILNGDYIKLRQVTLGYTVGEKMFQSLPLFRSVTISLVGRNLATLMKKSENIDPESSFSATPSSYGIEGTSLPFTRTFGFNANFKFKK
ncbi:MAG: SusC/RagA family TonB-linked outer membrane protein [Puia sp.]|nr:SusC/RagA family TonB-linked outer membrane protein [Puia sp.]